MSTNHQLTEVRAISSSYNSENRRASPFMVAMRDLIDGFRHHHIWLLLGWQDIKQRYRRSVLGPFWLTLSTAVVITGMGPLYGRLLGQSVLDYWPFLSASIVLWGLMATLIGECCGVFTSAEGIIKQLKLPLSLHVYRLVWRNFIIFAHNMVFVLPVMIFLGPGINANWLLIPVGLFLYAANSIWLGLVLGVLCARFRDIPLIVTTIVQLMFIMTPVFWKPEMLGDRQWAAHINPMFHMLEIVRAPLLGQTGSALSWMVVGGMTVFGYLLALVLFAKFRSRVAYWL